MIIFLRFHEKFSLLNSYNKRKFSPMESLETFQFSNCPDCICKRINIIKTLLIKIGRSSLLHSTSLNFITMTGTNSESY